MLSFGKERQFQSSDAAMSINYLDLVMALPRESHSREIGSKNESVYENAVTGIQSHAPTHRLLCKFM